MTGRAGICHDRRDSLLMSAESSTGLPRAVVVPTSSGALGLVLALVSAASFSTAGTFARSLCDAGWSPPAAVTARIGCAAVVLLVPAPVALRGRWYLLRRHFTTIVIYGLVTIAGCQLCYFNAVAHLSIGVALLLEYLGIVLIVGYLWLRH